MNQSRREFVCHGVMSLMALPLLGLGLFKKELDGVVGTDDAFLETGFGLKKPDAVDQLRARVKAGERIRDEKFVLTRDLDLSDIKPPIDIERCEFELRNGVLVTLGPDNTGSFSYNYLKGFNESHRPKFTFGEGVEL